MRRGSGVRGKKPDIVHNTISGAKWGIIVAGGAPSIRDRNRVENNTVPGLGYGLYVTSTSPFNVTDNNTFSNNLKAGIYIGTNANVAISKDNVISHNTQYGIWIQGGNATISDRNRIDHSQYGVYMDTSYAPSVRDNNTINNNSVAGIYLSSSVGTFNGQIWWNDLVDNGEGISAQNPASGVYFHAECNWWKDSNGPNDPSLGPPDQWNNSAGQNVSDYFFYRDRYTNDPYWLQEPSLTATSCKGPQP